METENTLSLFSLSPQTLDSTALSSTANKPSQRVLGDKWEYSSLPIVIVDFGPVLNTNVS